MMRIYRALLRLYPESFRSALGDEMLATLARVEADRSHFGKLRRILQSAEEISGLLAGIFVERCRLRRSINGIPAVTSGCSLPAPRSVAEEITEAEESIRFHLAKTLDCIAHHRFEGARYHAREEDQSRQRLRAALEQLPKDHDREID